MPGKVRRRYPNDGVSLKSSDEQIIEFGRDGISGRHVGVPMEDELHEGQGGTLGRLAIVVDGSREGKPPEDHLQQGETQTPYVRGHTVTDALNSFGTHVGIGTDETLVGEEMEMNDDENVSPMKSFFFVSRSLYGFVLYEDVSY